YVVGKYEVDLRHSGLTVVTDMNSHCRSPPCCLRGSVVRRRRWVAGAGRSATDTPTEELGERWPSWLRLTNRNSRLNSCWRHPDHGDRVDTHDAGRVP